MEITFSPEANFNGIALTNNSVGISRMGIPCGFFAIRPFYYEIRDDRSGAILFMKEILNPA